MGHNKIRRNTSYTLWTPNYTKFGEVVSEAMLSSRKILEMGIFCIVFDFFSINLAFRKLRLLTSNVSQKTPKPAKQRNWATKRRETAKRGMVTLKRLFYTIISSTKTKATHFVNSKVGDSAGEPRSNTFGNTHFHLLIAGARKRWVFDDWFCWLYNYGRFLFFFGLLVTRKSF